MKASTILFLLSMAIYIPACLLSDLWVAAAFVAGGLWRCAIELKGKGE